MNFGMYGYIELFMFPWQKGNPGRDCSELPDANALNCCVPAWSVTALLLYVQYRRVFSTSQDFQQNAAVLLYSTSIFQLFNFYLCYESYTNS